MDEFVPAPSNLTLTQRRILAYHASGLTLQQVGLEMHLSYSAVTANIQWAKDLLDGRTLGQLVAKATARGFISMATGAEEHVFPVALPPKRIAT